MLMVLCCVYMILTLGKDTVTQQGRVLNISILTLMADPNKTAAPNLYFMYTLG